MQLSKGKKSSYINHMYNADDRDTRAWCPFCPYVLSEACRLLKWQIHYSVYTVYRDVCQIA